MPVHEAKGRLYGPGVLDMKAGIVMMKFALQALLQLGELPRPVTVVLTTDEEVGSEDWPWRTADGIGYHKDLPTHWQPLPPPPSEG